MNFSVAIIGRPNVGKSTLFNRLTGKQQALVDPTPGLTRDRKEGNAQIGDLEFTIIDTAGLEKAEEGSLEKLMMEQTEEAIAQADIIFMMIDGRDGVTNMDEYFAAIVRKINKPTILLVNKCESKKSNSGILESYSLGFGEPMAISAEHGEGLGDIYLALQDKLEVMDYEEIEKIDIDNLSTENLQISIVGRPNAGKSTLFNRLLKENRSIISPVAGTTRDSVYVNWEYKDRNIKLVDTAGMRKKAKTHEKPEKLSVYDSLKAIQYANVVVLLLDATQALDRQDLTIADHVTKEGRGLVIAVNKWDLIEDKKEMLEEVRYKLNTSLSQAKDVPVVTLSAEYGKNPQKVIEAALKVFDIWNKRISTGRLNKWLDRAVSKHIPPLSKGRRVKFRYITQAKGRPPTFILFSTSNLKELPDSYFKYLTNSLREEFGFEGVPVRITIRKGENPYDRK